MALRDVLDQAVEYLALGRQPLVDRLEKASLPLAAVSGRDLESEEERALHARVELGLRQLRRVRLAARDCSLMVPPELGVPAFAFEATASHIVDLRDETSRRALRALRAAWAEQKR